MGEMAVMGRKGDVKTMWNPDNEDEVKAAKKQWDDLVGKKRFRAFRVKGDGKKGEQISDFDPDAAKLIIVPPMAGGQALGVRRSEEEIDRVQNWAEDHVERGEQSFPGMSYEDGVANALRWVLGQSDDAPDEE